LEDNDLGNSTNESGAKSGALGAESTPIDPDLATIIDAWPTLPEAVRQQVVGFVKAADGR
jgi:hypothetical protein